MRYRTLMYLGAGVPLVAAVTMIDTQHVLWDPTWSVRLGMGAVGVLLAITAILVGRGRVDQ